MSEIVETQVEEVDKNNANPAETKEVETKEIPKESYSEEALKKLLGEAKKEWETEKKEEDRLAKLSKEEQEKEILKKQGELIAQKEKELAYKELTLKTTELLEEKGLPTSFKSFLVSEDEEKTVKNITIFEKEFQGQLEKMVNQKLAGTSPIRGIDSPSGSFTKEAIEKMSPEEINKNWVEVCKSLQNIQ